MNKIISTIDSHTEGNPTRVIVDGVKIPEGSTVLERKVNFEKHQDQIRRLLNHEPRGGALMCSVLLMPPISAQADFSILIMEQEGYVPMCGHCLIGTATTLVSAKLVEVKEPVTKIVFETIAGIVSAYVNVENMQPKSVTIENVESFVLLENKKISVEGLGELTIDVGYGGDFYPIIDADFLGLELDATNEKEIVNTAQQIRRAVQQQISVTHPENDSINSCYQVQFISQKTKNGGNIRNTVVAPPGAMDRSPCGTGTSNLTARAVKNKIIKAGEDYIVEGPLNTKFIGKITKTSTRNGITYFTPHVTGRAYITSHSNFSLSDSDPFPMGFQVGQINS